MSAAAPSLTPEALPAVTLPSARTMPPSLASASSVVSGRGCSSVCDAGHAAFAVLDLDRDNFLVERPLRLGRRGPLLRAQRERVLVRARDLVFVGDVLGRLGHRIDAVELFHHRIDEAPADGGVENLRRALEGALAPCP